MADQTSRPPEPTPEQRFRRSVYIATAIGVLLLLYVVVADQFMPLTPESRVLYDTTRIAPEVPGTVVRVNVANGQAVKAGQVLFEIDSTRYELAVRSAKLALEETERTIRQRDADIAAARAAVASARAVADDAVRQARRQVALAEQRVVPASAAEAAVARRDESLAALRAAEARLQAVLVQRGEQGPDNLYLREAKNNLAIAQRDLEHTRVVALEDGIVTNMRLRPGNYVPAGTPVLALVGLKPTITADFREKALNRVNPGDPAIVSLDALPGRVFVGRVVSVDAGIAQGQLNPDGSLVETVETDRWIRRAQRVRVNVQLEDPPQLVSGSRATVQLVPHSSTIARVFAEAQIRLLAALRYVY
ncbi:efflux RND transporter periplasmic adaptor subunit [Pseudoxanthomonas sp. SGNA-20]|uniref:HlyD family secretion protein n=1 Tax=Pseudoxanthomonas sp. SGNA-20 TaxID=2493088 RepID=UPI00131A3E67|nr:efflux RND transporter periplasmic adaptor subunit [Pseudoxanthomonas sp. SGNA-20]